MYLLIRSIAGSIIYIVPAVCRYFKFQVSI